MTTGVFNEIFSSGQIFLMTLWNRFDRFATHHKKQFANPVNNIEYDNRNDKSYNHVNLTICLLYLHDPPQVIVSEAS